MDEIARLTPTFTGVSFEKHRSSSAASSGRATTQHPDGTPTMHVGEFVRGKGKFLVTEYVPTTEKVNAQVSADPDHRPHPVAVQRRRADAAHRQRRLARRGPARDPSARRRGARHQDGDWVGMQSRAGETVLRAAVTERVQPGVVYTTFHFPELRRQRHHHRQLGLGDQLPRVQGDRGAGRRG